MCGRYSLAVKKAKIIEQLDLEKEGDEADDLLQFFNIAPTHEAFVVADEEPKRLQKMTWGLVPSWSKDGTNRSMLINARAESIAEKTAYQKSVRERRCLVVADSFYEWKSDPSTGRKTPMRIFRKDGELLVFAGIWDVWSKIKSFSIITCPPNLEMKAVHDRMPVVFLDQKEVKTWLEKGWGEAQKVLLKTPENGFLAMHRVSEKVGSVAENGTHLHVALVENPTLF